LETTPSAIEPTRAQPDPTRFADDEHPTIVRRIPKLPWKFHETSLRLSDALFCELDRSGGEQPFELFATNDGNAELFSFGHL
jgi:hypothetical protein